jgi:hypothetical protein
MGFKPREPMSYSLAEYDPMALQDWSGIMPQGVFAGSNVQPSNAMLGLVAGGGKHYQPWALAEDFSLASPIIGSAGVEYDPAGTIAPGTNTTTTDDGTTTTDDGTTTTDDDATYYIGPKGDKWDSFHHWYMESPWDPTIINNHAAALKRIRDNQGVNLNISNIFSGLLGEDEEDSSLPIVTADPFIPDTNLNR